MSGERGDRDRTGVGEQDAPSLRSAEKRNESSPGAGTRASCAVVSK
jgi:hypothetical protein